MSKALWDWAVDADFAWTAVVNGRQCRVISHDALDRPIHRHQFEGAVRVMPDDVEDESAPVIVCTPCLDGIIKTLDLSDAVPDEPLHPRFFAELHSAAYQAGEESHLEFWSSYNHSEMSSSEDIQRVERAWAAAHKKRDEYTPWTSAWERFRAEFYSQLVDRPFEEDEFYSGNWMEVKDEDGLEYAQSVMEFLGAPSADDIEDELRQAFVEGAMGADTSHPADLLPNRMLFVWTPGNNTFPDDPESIIENPSYQKNTQFLNVLDALNISGEDFYMAFLAWHCKNNERLDNPEEFINQMEHWRPACFRHKRARPDEPPLLPLNLILSFANSGSTYDWSPVVALSVDTKEFLSLEQGDKISITKPVLGAIDWTDGSGDADSYDISVNMDFNPAHWGIDKPGESRSLSNIIDAHSSFYKAEITDHDYLKRQEAYFGKICELMGQIVKRDDSPWYNWKAPGWDHLPPPDQIAERFIESRGLAFDKDKASHLRALAEQALQRSLAAQVPDEACEQAADPVFVP